MMRQRQRQRQRHRQLIDTEEEERAGRQVPRITKEIHAPRRRQQELHLTLYQPRRSGDHQGPGWMFSSFLSVYVGGEQIQSLELPVQPKDIKEWKETMTHPVDSGWRGLSVGIEAVRKDFCVLRGRVMVFRTKEPHTSSQTAVFGTVQVPLLDALVLGDDDDSDDEEKKKKKRRTELKLVEGTEIFNERVQLQSWRWEEGREPTNVVCGTVGVRMCITDG